MAAQRPGRPFPQLRRNLYDVFGVLRYQQGNAQTPWRWTEKKGAEEMLIHLSGGSYLVPMSGVVTGSGSQFVDPCETMLTQCLRGAEVALAACLATVGLLLVECLRGCLAAILPPLIKACMKACVVRSLLLAAGCIAVYAGASYLCWKAYSRCRERRPAPTPIPYLPPASPYAMPVRPAPDDFV